MNLEEAKEILGDRATWDKKYEKGFNNVANS